MHNEYENKFAYQTGHETISFKQWMICREYFLKLDELQPETVVEPDAVAYDAYATYSISCGYQPIGIQEWKDAGKPVSHLSKKLSNAGIKPEFVTGDDAKAMKFARTMHEEYIKEDRVDFRTWITEDASISIDSERYIEYAIYVYNIWDTDKIMSYTDFSRKQPTLVTDSPFKEVELPQAGTMSSAIDRDVQMKSLYKGLRTTYLANRASKHGHIATFEQWLDEQELTTNECYYVKYVASVGNASDAKPYSEWIKPDVHTYLPNFTSKAKPRNIDDI